jgi:carbon storage regulator
MLMMSRREGEAILIGDEIEIVIARVGRTRIKVGINAPRHMPVIAREWSLVREANMAAAITPSGPELKGLVERLRSCAAPRDAADKEK